MRVSQFIKVREEKLDKDSNFHKKVTVKSGDITLQIMTNINTIGCIDR